MVERLRIEMRRYFDDIEKVVTSKVEMLKMKERTLEFFNVMVDEIEEIMDYKVEEIEDLSRRQEEAEKKTEELKKKMDELLKDIYDEYDDFEIVCPYCNYEFSAEINESSKEIACPECKNIIELDWSGDPDDGDDNQSGCGGNCNNCDGCDDD